jgi:2-oxo-4-hydroxy-4-carboxy-5-ureidoimidazoline decarboxylase
MNLDRLNTAPFEQIKRDLLHCCHCENWAQELLLARPYASEANFMQAAEANWFAQAREGWLEAFAAHPKIGDVESLKKKYQNTLSTATQEQGLVAEASQSILQGLARLNHEYEKKFGFIFIVFATGKSAAQMLALLEARHPNTRDQELQNAAQEQWKITKLRMEKSL